MDGEVYEQGSANPTRKSIAWNRDPIILARMAEVDRRHIAGQTNVAIAAALGVEEGTIRNDLKRLAELWKERIGEQAEDLRAGIIRELDDTRRLALNAAAFDEAAERAVLYGQAPGLLLCPGDGEHRIKQEGKPFTEWPFCDAPHETPIRVQRDDKGSAQFRGNKAAALTVARQASMDKAKVLGLVIEKQEHTGALPVRVYEVEIPDADRPTT